MLLKVTIHCLLRNVSAYLLSVNTPFEIYCNNNKIVTVDVEIQFSSTIVVFLPNKI